MKVTCANRPDGRHCLSLTPEKPGEPSPPLRDLLIDASIIGIPGDRLAAIAALAYGPHLRGVLSTERPVSTLMSRALTAFLDPVFITPSNISSEGTQFTGSGSTLVLDPDHQGYLGRNRVNRTQVISLDVLPMTTWTGRLFSMDRLVIASNANLFSRRRTGSSELGPYLAVALAFAHELHVSRVVLPTEVPPSDEWLTRAGSLLAATGVHLVVTSPDSLSELDLVEE